MFNCELSAPAIVPLLQEICYLIYSSFILHRTLHWFLLWRGSCFGTEDALRTDPDHGVMVYSVLSFTKIPILMFKSDFSQALTGAGIRTNFTLHGFLVMCLHERVGPIWPTQWELGFRREGGYFCRFHLSVFKCNISWHNIINNTSIYVCYIFDLK
jgi:hypothetical protein